ncbi:HNH endonuclease [Curtobacterium flaccumfaciens]|uniref:HNH endonuclease n=1 Tax=Curtobacterium flaccumfaciens TaxID=2035 RepID=UPI001E49DC67|nr:HNH endonuclease [Curtobacterium allii]MCE0456846.1 HNH endonuclease [Curtobacterium allii]
MSKQDLPLRTELEALEDRVRIAYQAFDDGRATDPRLSWGHDDRVALQSNWPKVSNTFLRARVFASTRGICAYCGTVPAAQIDHYLPKALFGEYSIHVPNLVPSCGPCNGHKAKRYQLDSGMRRYPHPYFAELPNEALIRATLTLSPVVTVSYEVDEVVARAVGVLDLVVAQFDDLHLNELFITETVAYLSDRACVYADEFAANGAVGVVRVLERDRRSVVRSRGETYWEVALLDALIASDGFCTGGFNRIVAL